MKIGITKKEFAYIPEAYAYTNYLQKFGHQIQFDFEHNLDPDNDVNIYFMGVKPFWKKKQGSAREIHEYQSLSTGNYPIIKNYVKKLVNSKPNKRIFLNEVVDKGFNFQDNIPSIYRDMGVDESFFIEPSLTYEFDIVYCGSIEGRIGLVETILKLSAKYKIIVIGDVNSELQRLFRASGVSMTGRLDRKYIPQIYAKCRFGLNYTPDVYPYNIQTSTKTLEYLATGLTVISNKYHWIEKFSQLNSIRINWLGELMEELEFDSNEKRNNMEIMMKYEWSNILNGIGFIKFIESYE